jgi:hypothetical protein
MDSEPEEVVDIEAWANAFVRAYSRNECPGPDDPDWWAIERSMFVLRQDAGEELWEFILAALAKRPSQHVLAVLAAGPLEDLIAYAGKFFVDRIELAARRDPAFRHLLGGVWQNGTPANIWERIELARGKLW